MQLALFEFIGFYTHLLISTFMTITQLEYIVAIDTYRHFVTAAEKCFVTQPTLSMQVQKLEQELGVKIFDRSKHPLEPTPLGVQIITHARRILEQVDTFKEFLSYEIKGEIGQIRLGVIPTLAPYLLPLFLGDFLKAYPHYKLHIEELQTEQIIERLKDYRLDIGLAAIPLEEKELKEYPLFEEAFTVFLNPLHPLKAKNQLQETDLKGQKVWLLQQGHCFRNQTLQICGHEAGAQEEQFFYESGSIETLKGLVEHQAGLTLLPQLATYGLSEQQKQHLRPFADPTPVREIGLIVHQNFYKTRFLEHLTKSITDSLPQEMRLLKQKKIVHWRNFMR